MKLSITSISTRLSASKTYQTLFWVLFSLSFIFLFFDTFDNGHDFVVMYRAGWAFLHYEPIYSTVRDGGMVFKYPPWWVFFFIPFGLFPLVVAKAFWAIANVASLISVFFSLRRLGFSFLSVSLSMMAFWGIWAVHFIDGQIEVLVLALVLLTLERIKRKPHPRLSVAVVYLMSIKGPSVLGAIGVLSRKHFFKTGALFLLIVAVSLIVSSIATSHGFNILSDWKSAATSGSQMLEPDKAILGRDNQGIPALIQRVYHASYGQKLDEFVVNGVVLAIGSILFFYLFSGIRLIPKVFFWLAASVILHPLAWFHLFVWSLPLVVYVVDRALKKETHTLWIWFPLLVAAVTERTAATVGQLLEFYSFKALIIFVALIWFSHIEKKSLRA